MPLTLDAFFQTATGKWYFAIIDTIAGLTDSANPQVYWHMMKKRLANEGNATVTNCNTLKMTDDDGKQRLTDVADTEQLLHLIQSISSPQPEPFKLWLARVGYERLEKIAPPGLAAQRMREIYQLNTTSGRFTLAADQIIVISVGSDPDPAKPVSRFDSQSAMTDPHTNRPHLADFPKMQRRMARIAHPQPIVLPRQLPDRHGQPLIRPPKFTRPRGFHPAAWLSLAVNRPELRPPENLIVHLPHPVRSADPTPPRAVRASDLRAPRLLRPAAAESLLRFPEPYSYAARCFNGAALARPGFKGAALRRARKFRLALPNHASRKLTFNGAALGKARKFLGSEAFIALRCNPVLSLSTQLNHPFLTFLSNTHN